MTFLQEVERRNEQWRNVAGRKRLKELQKTQRVVWAALLVAVIALIFSVGCGILRLITP
jgi:hypothetical protein